MEARVDNMNTSVTVLQNNSGDVTASVCSSVGCFFLDHRNVKKKKITRIFMACFILVMKASVGVWRFLTRALH